MALLLVWVGLVLTDRTAVEQGVVGDAIGRDLVRLADLAALRGSEADGPTASMPVMVTQDGGPGWLTAQAEAAVERDPVFERGDPHLLQVEVVEFRGVFGVRCQLWRQGWSLRAPQPLWVTPAPWVVWLSVLAGVAVAVVGRRLVAGLWVAALLVQWLLTALPWPADVPRVSWSATVEQGPLAHAVTELARALPEASGAFGAGVITLCVLLMIFDHRRAAEGSTSLLAGAAAVLALAVWIEGATRAGLVPWLLTAGGAVSALGLSGLWWGAWRRAGETTESPS